MANFWEKYGGTAQPAQNPQTSPQTQEQVMPDPFGGPQEMTRQFRDFVGNFRGNPQEEAQKILANATPAQRAILERLVPACIPLVQGRKTP